MPQVKMSKMIRMASASIALELGLKAQVVERILEVDDWIDAVRFLLAEVAVHGGFAVAELRIFDQNDRLVGTHRIGKPMAICGNDVVAHLIPGGSNHTAVVLLCKRDERFEHREFVLPEPEIALLSALLSETPEDAKTPSALLDSTVFKAVERVRDADTFFHQETVASFTTTIARAIKYEEFPMKELHLAGRFHDIGKLWVPTAILHKPGRLTPQETSVLALHPTNSAIIAAGFGFSPFVVKLIRDHHERFDGSGYPDRLSGSDVSLAASVLGLADYLAAYSAERSYHGGRSIEDALIEADQSGSFDPRVIAAARSVIVELTGNRECFL